MLTLEKLSTMGGVILILFGVFAVGRFIVKRILRRIVSIIIILIGIALLVFSVSEKADAESKYFFSKSWTYKADGQSEKGADITISFNDDDEHILREDFVNDETVDNYVYYRLSSDGKVGDSVTVTISSDYPGTFLGITIMPKKDGKWLEGSQYALHIEDDPEAVKEITQTITVEPDVTDVQIALQAHPTSFTSKKPGCMDVIFTLEMNGHNEIKEKNGDGLKLIATIFGGLMFLIILAGILSKVNVYKQNKNKK